MTHVRRDILTHNTMCDWLHNSVVHHFALKEKVYMMSSACEAEKTAMKVCVCVQLHNVEGAPMTFQWHGRAAVSDHLPSGKLEST